jgi:tetratricopeptide (TPR) repeat protein
MKKSVIVATFAFFAFAVGAAWAQLGQIGGKILGEDGKPLVNAKVVYTDPNTGRKYNFKTDKKGQYAGLGIPYGKYQVTINNEKGQEVVNMTASVGVDPADNEIDLDLSKPESQQLAHHVSNSGTGGGPGGPAVGGHTLPSTQGLDQNQGKSKDQGQNQAQNQTQNQGQGQISPGGEGGKSGQQQQPKYTKEQVEEIKKQNEKAGNMNALIQQATSAMNAKNWQEAVGPLQQLVAMDPNDWQFYSALGDSQLNLGQFDQAVDTYSKGIQAAENMTTVDPKKPSSDPVKKKTGVAKMLTNEGNAYLKLHKNKEAVDAYTKAAGMDPNPSVAYFNLCATQYNTGNVDGALEACDKAIAADPTKADAYFIKGSLLIASSKQDKDGKIEAPPGTAEALNKYLQLAPEGAHVNDVKQMLEYIGSKVETTYKKKGK